MRYQIFSLQQSSLVELGLNVEEALLLDWILNWKDGTGMKREFIEEQQDIGYWINYETRLRELNLNIDVNYLKNRLSHHRNVFSINGYENWRIQ